MLFEWYLLKIKRKDSNLAIKKHFPLKINNKLQALRILFVVCERNSFLNVAGNVRTDTEIEEMLEGGNFAVFTQGVSY